MFEFWDEYNNIEQFSKVFWTFDEVQESTTKSSLIFFDSWWQDADIVWLHNPFTQLAENTDFQVACDRYNNAPESLLNEPNTGFVYTCANDRTIEFYKYWYAARERHPGKHDQDVLSIIIREQRFLDLGLKVRFLHTRFFSGFCQVQHYNTSYKSDVSHWSANSTQCPVWMIITACIHGTCYSNLYESSANSDV